VKVIERGNVPGCVDGIFTLQLTSDQKLNAVWHNFAGRLGGIATLRKLLDRLLKCAGEVNHADCQRSRDALETPGTTQRRPKSQRHSVMVLAHGVEP